MHTTKMTFIFCLSTLAHLSAMEIIINPEHFEQIRGHGNRGCNDNVTSDIIDTQSFYLLLAHAHHQVVHNNHPARPLQELISRLRSGKIDIGISSSRISAEDYLNRILPYLNSGLSNREYEKKATPLSSSYHEDKHLIYLYGLQEKPSLAWLCERVYYPISSSNDRSPFKSFKVKDFALKDVTISKDELALKVAAIIRYLEMPKALSASL